MDDAQAMLDSIHGTVGEISVEDPKMRMRDVDVFYAEKQAIYEVDLDVAKNEVIAMIGPSGCGKSTFLRCLNRMNDTIPICRVEGSITLDDVDIYARDQDPVLLRARVGMVFQKPTRLPRVFSTTSLTGRVSTGLHRTVQNLMKSSSPV